MYLDSICTHVKCDIRHMQEIIRKIFLDHIPFIPTADDEIINAMMGVNFHDMPQDRLATNLYHGFGSERGFLSYSRA